MMKYVVSRGANRGLGLVPHQHRDGKYVASPTRFKKDYVRTSSLTELEELARRGMKVRMSPKTSLVRRAPSLVIPEID